MLPAFFFLGAISNVFFLFIIDTLALFIYHLNFWTLLFFSLYKRLDDLLRSFNQLFVSLYLLRVLGITKIGLLFVLILGVALISRCLLFSTLVDFLNFRKSNTLKLDHISIHPTPAHSQFGDEVEDSRTSKAKMIIALAKEALMTDLIFLEVINFYKNRC